MFFPQINIFQEITLRNLNNLDWKKKLKDK